MEISFKCKVCGRVESSEEAGESFEPGFCRVCGSKGWIKLWELPPDEQTAVIESLDPSYSIVEHVQPSPEEPEEDDE